SCGAPIPAAIQGQWQRIAVPIRPALFPVACGRPWSASKSARAGYCLRCSIRLRSSRAARAWPGRDTATPAPHAGLLLTPAGCVARCPSRASGRARAFSGSAGPTSPAVDQSGFPSGLLSDFDKIRLWFLSDVNKRMKKKHTADDNDQTDLRRSEQAREVI